MSHGLKKVNYAIEVELPLMVFREGKQFVAHTPLLDVSTSGSTFEQAKERFHEAVEIFFEELVERGTLEEVLQELGWQKVRSKWEPPVMIAHNSERVTVPAVA